MLVDSDRCVLSKVHSHSISEDNLTIELLTEVDGVLGVVEGYDDTAHRFERRPAVNVRGLLDQVSQYLQVGGVEHAWLSEVCYEECIRGRRRLD